MIKTSLEEAGIESSIFSAHSTREASATSAANQGVPVSKILKAADWSTFNKLYYRPANNPAFTHAVLADQI